MYTDISLQLDRTPLIAASGSGFPGVVRILLDRIKDDPGREEYLNSVMDVSVQLTRLIIVRIIGTKSSTTQRGREDNIQKLEVELYT